MSVAVYTDGCQLTGPNGELCGGYAAIIQFEDGSTRLAKGRELGASSSRMELRAAVEGLRALRVQEHVIVISDACSLVDPLERGYLLRWEANGWRNAQGRPVADADLWDGLLAQMGRHGSVHWHRVKGHSNHHWHNRADRLARGQAGRLRFAAEHRPQRAVAS